MPTSAVGQLYLARAAAAQRRRSRSRRRRRASRALPRPDGSYQAIPEVHGRTKTFPHRRARGAVDAQAGPDGHGQHLQRRRSRPGAGGQARRHGRHRLSQRRRDAGHDPSARHPRHSGHDGRRRRHLAAAGSARRTLSLSVSSPITPGTFIYHTHGEEAMLDSGLYGAIIVEPATSAARRARASRTIFSR